MSNNMKLDLLGNLVKDLIVKDKINLAQEMIKKYIADPKSIVSDNTITPKTKGDTCKEYRKLMDSNTPKIKKARTEKVKKYTKEDIINMLKQNMSTDEISAKSGFSKNSIKAYKAHVTMGRYQ